MLVDPLTKGLPLKFLKDYVVHMDLKVNLSILNWLGV